MSGNRAKPLDFPIVNGRGPAPGINLASSAALLDFLDEIDGVYERFRPGATPTPGHDPDRRNDDD
ncbi:MAG TPA: hypothetical protein VJ787_00010 [Thermoleophilia bacterium]|nr:hypothetical protein [Thermoleophilia bacterium]